MRQMQDLPEDGFAKFLHALTEPPQAGIRANGLKITPSELESLLLDLERVPWCADGFYMPPVFRAGKSPLYHAGLYYIQEPSAMSAVEALGVCPGDKVLDLCAAPGGKSTQLASALGGGSVLVCNDVSRSRLKALVKNLELAGAINTVVTCEEPRRLSRVFSQYFNKILIDAPCSGEGMFRKDKDVQKAYSDQKVEAFARLSKEILECASLMLAPGGRLLFSTCTFNKTENEDTAEDFLARHPDFYPVEIDIPGGEEFERGFGRHGEYFRRLFPHRVRGEGHFLALFEREGALPDNRAFCAQQSFRKPTKGQYHALRTFEEDALYQDALLNMGDVFAMGDTLYSLSLPRGFPPLEGVRLVKTGLRLGEVRGAHFLPGQALAMALTKSDANYTVDFDHTSTQVIKYLKGDTLELGGAQQGWVLVCTQGHPLGWAKARDGTLKNKYNRHWLME